MRGKFAGIFENRIRNLQATLKETSVQPQSERDKRHFDREAVAGRQEGTGGIPMGILPSARDLYLLEISFQSAKKQNDVCNCRKRRHRVIAL